MTSPKHIQVWIRVKHGKKTTSEQVVAGVIPKVGGRDAIPRKMHFEVKAKVREEFMKTGRIVPAERVEEIIATLRLASALT